jgi:DNA-binding MarR family transcriptional regulator
MDDRDRIVQIGDSLRELKNVYFCTARLVAENFGITSTQFLALRILRKKPQIGLNELAERMHTGASTASGVVDRLVQAGYIERERLDSDRRSIVLKLSPEGEELLDRTNDRILNRLSPILQLSNEEVEQLLKTHRKIIALLQQTREDQ